MYGLKNVRNRRTDSLSRVGWDQLESLLATYYQGQGYRVELVGTGASSARFDGGIDLKLYKDDEYIVVQCKHWNAKQVPHNDVHQLLGIMVNEGATGAILVSSGEFTPYARESAAKHGHVQLIDGDALRAMIGPLPEPPSTASSSAADPEALVFRAQRRAKGRSPVGARASSNLAWWLVALVFAVAFLFLIRALLDRTAWSAGNAPTVQSASPEMLSRPSGAVPAVMDTPAGAQDQPSNMLPPKQPTAAEIRESQRKADEAIRLLEADTPEM